LLCDAHRFDLAPDCGRVLSRGVQQRPLKLIRHPIESACGVLAITALHEAAHQRLRIVLNGLEGGVEGRTEVGVKFLGLLVGQQTFAAWRNNSSSTAAEKNSAPARLQFALKPMIRNVFGAEVSLETLEGTLDIR
jgi:hypothetical protein